MSHHALRHITITATIVFILPCTLVTSFTPQPECDALHSWNVSLYHFPPFIAARANSSLRGGMHSLLSDMFTSCCKWGGDFPNVLTHDNARALEYAIDHHVTFALPVTRNTIMSSLYSLRTSHTYIPIIQTQGPFLLMDSDRLDDAIALSLASSWPLLIVVLGSAGIAAIIIWALDNRRNPSHFPSSFPRGFWEGYWWAFVTMTTVGYGDKTPVSIPGRFFGLIWITLGVIIMSVFTATLAAAFTSASTMSTDIRGVTIGVLNGSEEYIVAVSQGANTIVYPNYYQLIRAATDDTSLHGMLVDRYFLLSEGQELTANMLQVVGQLEAPASHGLLVSNARPGLVTCVADFIMANRFYVYDHVVQNLHAREIDNDQYLERMRSFSETTAKLFSTQSLAMYVILGLWTFLFVLCMTVEAARWAKLKLTVSHAGPHTDQNGKIKHISKVNKSQQINCPRILACRV